MAKPPKTITRGSETAQDCGFGRPYGGLDWETDKGVLVGMWRKGQRVRFFSADCKQHGPELSNVAPAVAYAYSRGWRDVTAPAWLNAGARREARAR